MAYYDSLDFLFEDLESLDIDYESFNSMYLDEEQWTISFQIKQCVLGCLSSVQNSIGKLILVTLLQRLIVLMSFHDVVKHLSYIVLGIAILPDWIQKNDLRLGIIAGIPILVGSLLLVPCNCKGVVAICACIMLIVFVQYIIEPADFLSIRGMLMVFAMKISALMFDKEPDCSGSKVISILAYLFSPATVVFGPFHTYEEFMKSMHSRATKKELASMITSAALMGIAFGFLTYSSCVSIVLPQNGIFSDYGVAQSFRTSHYFVCFLSQGLALLAGIRLYTCSPFSVELPRSLVEVVVAWNVPMHRFLHKYVYSNSIGFGVGAAIFVSFSVSSLLHGFNFQITAVLLSLGFACYYENKLRNRIASCFSMCVRARPCKNCNHERKSNSAQVMMVNTAFFAIAVYQLIYLGAPFNGEGAEVGYDAGHTLAIWKRHRFLGHALIAITNLMSYCF